MTAGLVLPLMLGSVGIGVLLTLAAAVLQAQERAADRPVRWIWALAIALTVGLTALMPLRERAAGTSAKVSPTGPRLLLPTVDIAPSEAPGMLAVLRRWPRAAVDATSARIDSAVRAASSLPLPVHRAATVLWMASSALCGLTLLAVYRRVRRGARTWARERLLGTAVRVSQDAGPAVVGLRPMEIVVPSWILHRPPQEQQLVLQHEQEHIRARDPVLLLAACIAVVLLPWNPLLWYALSRMRLAVEIDCDRRVLRGGFERHRYGRLLLDLSEHPSSLAAALPALSYGASHLERRLLAMTSRPARFARARRIGGAAVATALLLAACESRMPTSAEVEDMDASKAVATASKLPGIDTARASYVVDGKHVSKAEAEGFAASRIASIEVVRGKDRAAQIRLRTLNYDTSVVLEASRIRISDSTVSGTGDVVSMTSGVEFAPARASVAPLMRKRADSSQATANAAAGSRVRVRDMYATPPQGAKRGFDGIFIIDGKQVSDTVANSIQPNSIESIEVIKGAAAAALYSDPRAVHGVISIRTKRP